MFFKQEKFNELFGLKLLSIDEMKLPKYRTQQLLINLIHSLGESYRDFEQKNSIAHANSYEWVQRKKGYALQLWMEEGKHIAQLNTAIKLLTLPKDHPLNSEQFPHTPWAQFCTIIRKYPNADASDFTPNKSVLFATVEEETRFQLLLIFLAHCQYLNFKEKELVDLWNNPNDFNLAIALIKSSTDHDKIRKLTMIADIFNVLIARISAVTDNDFKQTLAYLIKHFEQPIFYQVNKSTNFYDYRNIIDSFLEKYLSSILQHTSNWNYEKLEAIIGPSSLRERILTKLLAKGLRLSNFSLENVRFIYDKVSSELLKQQMIHALNNPLDIFIQAISTGGNQGIIYQLTDVAINNTEELIHFLEKILTNNSFNRLYILENLNYTGKMSRFELTDTQLTRLMELFIVTDTQYEPRLCFFEGFSAVILNHKYASFVDYNTLLDVGLLNKSLEQPISRSVAPIENLGRLLLIIPINYYPSFLASIINFDDLNVETLIQVFKGLFSSQILALIKDDRVEKIVLDADNIVKTTQFLKGKETLQDMLKEKNNIFSLTIDALNKYQSLFKEERSFLANAKALLADFSTPVSSDVRLFKKTLPQEMALVASTLDNLKLEMLPLDGHEAVRQLLQSVLREIKVKSPKCFKLLQSDNRSELVKNDLAARLFLLSKLAASSSLKEMCLNLDESEIKEIASTSIGACRS